MKGRGEKGRSGMRRRGCLVVLLGVMLLIALAVVLRQPFGRFGVGLAVRALARNIDGRVEYERIEGNLFRNPTVVGLRVHLDGDSLRVGRVSVRFAPLAVLFGRIPVSRLELTEPELFLAALPVADTAAAPEPAQPLRLPRLDLELVALHNARFYLGDSLRVDSFNFVASGRMDQDRMRLEVRRLEGIAVRESIVLRSGTARVRLNQTALRLEALDLRTDQSRLSGNVRMALDSSGAEITVTSLVVDLAEFAGLYAGGSDEPRGVFRAQGSARLDGTHPTADLKYGFERPGFGTLRLPDLAGAVKLDRTRLELTASGRDSLLGGLSIRGSFDYEELTYQGRVEIRGTRPSAFDPALPDLAFDADIDFAGTALDPVDITAAGRVPALGIDTFRLNGRRAGRLFELNRFMAQGPSGRVQAAGNWRTDGRFTGECLFESFDIAPFARLAGVEATGRLEGLVRGSGTADSIRASGGIRVDDFAFDDLAFASGILEFDATVGRELHGRVVAGVEQVRWNDQELAAAQITLLDADFDLRAERSEARLTARGGYRLSRDRLQVEVSGFEFASGAETLALVEPFTVDWSSTMLTVRGVRYEIADGLLELDLVRAGADAPELSLAVTGLDLDRFQHLLGLETGLSGRVDLVVSGRDTLAGQLSARDLKMPGIGLELGHLSVAARYSDLRVTLDRLAMVHDVDTSTVTGWAEFSTEDGFELAGFDLAVELADPGSWVLFFLADIAELRAGRIYGNLALRGNPAAPDLTGRVRISEGQLWIPAVSMFVERVNAEVTAAAGRVNIEKISGAAGAGVVTAEGFVQLGPDLVVDTLALDVRFDDAVIRPLPEVHLVASGSIVLALADKRPLSIEGTIIAREALLAFGFGHEAPPSAPEPDAPPVVFDIQIRGERGIWLRNRVADIELSVDLSVRKTLEGETWTGLLATRQGNIYYLDRTLRVTRGEIRFENIGTLDPDLDIVAELPVHSRNGEPDQLPERIILTLGGTLNRPDFRFSSEPAAWDENDIITYLSLNVAPGEFDAFQDREAIARYLSGRLLGLAQTQFTKQVRQWLAVDALRFESELTGGEGQRVTVGKYIGRNLYVTYSQSFTGELEPEFRVEYYLDRRNEIIGERNEDGRFSVRYRHRLRY